MTAIATNTHAPREDIYTRVTAKIITSLEQGVRPWVKPWSVDHTAGHITQPLRHNGQPYRGINILILWGDSVEKGFVSPFWLTFKQARMMKAHVRKGQRGSTFVYANRFTKEGTDEKGEAFEQEIPFLKSYTVFNAEQVEGLPEQFYARPESPLPLSERITCAHKFVVATNAELHRGGNMAFYAPGPDRIQLPQFEAFRSAESYYATLLHELTHWTQHESRLDRDLGRKAFGDKGYAREELVAELGAAFLCAELGIAAEPREDHAAYLSHWLTVLKEDKRASFRRRLMHRRPLTTCEDFRLPKSERRSGSARVSLGGYPAVVVAATFWWPPRDLQGRARAPRSMNHSPPWTWMAERRPALSR
jgi:antirestriction protein ArdC